MFRVFVILQGFVSLSVWLYPSPDQPGCSPVSPIIPRIEGNSSSTVCRLAAVLCCAVRLRKEIQCSFMVLQITLKMYSIFLCIWVLNCNIFFLSLFLSSSFSFTALCKMVTFLTSSCEYSLLF